MRSADHQRVGRHALASIAHEGPVSLLAGPLWFRSRPPGIGRAAVPADLAEAVRSGSCSWNGPPTTLPRPDTGSPTCPPPPPSRTWSGGRRCGGASSTTNPLIRRPKASHPDRGRSGPARDQSLRQEVVHHQAVGEERPSESRRLPLGVLGDERLARRQGPLPQAPRRTRRLARSPRGTSSTA
jgi:hypothetical protein